MSQLGARQPRHTGNSNDNGLGEVGDIVQSQFDFFFDQWQLQNDTVILLQQHENGVSNGASTHNDTQHVLHLLRETQETLQIILARCLASHNEVD